ESNDERAERVAVTAARRTETRRRAALLVGDIARFPFDERLARDASVARAAGEQRAGDRQEGRQEMPANQRCSPANHAIVSPVRSMPMSSESASSSSRG